MDHLNALPRGYRLQEYEIVRVLGVGGFGMTYLGFDHHLDVGVAIKEYLPNDLAVRRAGRTVVPKSTGDKADFEWGLERFIDEARTLARFSHPNLIQIRRFFQAHGTGYIVMDYAEGATVADMLARNGQISEASWRPILLQLLDGLGVVHERSFLHRDIKPGNIIVRTDGVPVLIDFGAARQAIGARSRSVTSIVTPGYAPIEQYSSRGRQGPWTDLYALAAVSYRALTGKMPDDATERIRDDPLVPAIEAGRGKASERLLAAIDWALAVDERARPQSVQEFRAALQDEMGARAGGSKARTPTPSRATAAHAEASFADAARKDARRPTPDAKSLVEQLSQHVEVDHATREALVAPLEEAARTRRTIRMYGLQVTLGVVGAGVLSLSLLGGELAGYAAVALGVIWMFALALLALLEHRAARQFKALYRELERSVLAQQDLWKLRHRRTLQRWLWLGTTVPVVVLIIAVVDDFETALPFMLAAPVMLGVIYAMARAADSNAPRLNRTLRILNRIKRYDVR
ncbi:MAG: serine/threonine protein kinase [Gammaproteobacteria bacterium]